MLISTPSTRLVTTDLNLLITPVEWQQLVEIIPQQLTGEGFMVTKISATEVSLTCEPDNMLVNQFEQAEGRSPTVEVLHRVLIVGSTLLPVVAVTTAVVSVLPTGTYWYGTTVEGELDDHGLASCAWVANPTH